MTHKEAIKNLMELQIRLINDNSEEAFEYNKKVYDTLAYFITQTTPLSIIEDIKAELQKEIKYPFTSDDEADAFNLALEIIDRKVNQAEHEENYSKWDKFEGETMIPLSVVLEIAKSIEARRDSFVVPVHYTKGVKDGLDSALEIINRKVNEAAHEED